MMALGHRRILSARLAASIGLLCGVLGLIAGTEDRVWKFGATGWFAGGSLLVLLALVVLVDGALASQSSAVLISRKPAADVTPEKHRGHGLTKP
jgi:hypothetical protein